VLWFCQYLDGIFKESWIRAKPLSKRPPLPLIKGKGIQGMGFPDKIPFMDNV